MSLYFSNHGKQYDSKLVLNKKKHILISKQKRDKKKKACFTKKIRYNPKTKMQNSKVPQQNDWKYNTLFRSASPAIYVSRQCLPTTCYVEYDSMKIW